MGVFFVYIISQVSTTEWNISSFFEKSHDERRKESHRQLQSR